MIDKRAGWTMSTGKKWTLKTTKQTDDIKPALSNYNHTFGKQDFSTPGPVYEIHNIKSIQGESSMQIKFGNFGIARD